MIACSSSAPDRKQFSESEQQRADSTGYISPSAAVTNPGDTSRKFVRTSDMKFRVRNVYRSTVVIEDIVSRSSGFVTLSELRSNTENTSMVPVSADSSLEIVSYTVRNSMMLRVPVTSLDTVLKQIASQIDFLDYRILKADDVKLRMLGNTLDRQRMKKHGERLAQAMDQHGKKPEETARAGESLLDKQAQADNAMLSNLSLTDQVNFSTLSIEIYQRAAVRRDLYENERNIKAYEPGLMKKLLESLAMGWQNLEALVLFIVKCWELLLLVTLVWLGYRRFVRKG